MIVFLILFSLRWCVSDGHGGGRAPLSPGVGGTSTAQELFQGSLSCSQHSWRSVQMGSSQLWHPQYNLGLWAGTPKGAAGAVGTLCGTGEALGACCRGRRVGQRRKHLPRERALVSLSSRVSCGKEKIKRQWLRGLVQGWGGPALESCHGIPGGNGCPAWGKAWREKTEEQNKAAWRSINFSGWHIVFPQFCYFSVWDVDGRS